MSLTDALAKALLTGEKLKVSGASNEANTKALMSEPLLAALGWDPTDLDVVEREVKVYDGTFLDYGLKAAGAHRLYVEAKAIGESLGDKKFVAQAVNYANNDGVVWCVLTNGLVWRVFKTNETAAMDKKLLFEIDISDESQPATDAAKLFRLISHESVVDGALDRYGERVFTDSRVRSALAKLAVDPPPELIDALGVHLGHPPVPVDALQRSLARIFDAPSSPTPTTGTTKLPTSGPPAGPPQPPQPAKGQEYSLEHHLGNKSALIAELFTEVNSSGMALAADVTRRIRKQYIGYFRGKRSFFTAELQKQRVLIYLSLTLDSARPWNPDTMRDVRAIGHFGMGDIEYSLTSSDQLDEVRALIKLAYETSS
jgi:predicted transport protein